MLLIPGGDVTGKAKDIRCFAAMSDHLSGDATKFSDKVV